MIDTPLEARVSDNKLKGVGAIDQAVVGKSERLRSGVFVASEIKEIKLIAIEKDLNFVVEINIESREVEVEVIGGI